MKKYLVALGIVLIDFITVGIPLGALFLAYIIINKPKWFVDFIEKI